MTSHHIIKALTCIAMSLTLPSWGMAQDCENAVRLLIDSVKSAAPKGWGSRLEFVGNPKESVQYIEREHHTIWYEINIVKPCLFTLEITPDNIHDDYDFMLFKAEGEDYCQDILRKKIKPIRSNISRNNKLIKSKTGLSPDAHHTHVHSGKGEEYSKALYVQTGERYLLLLDKVHDHGKGYTLRVSPCIGKPVDVPEDSLPEAPILLPEPPLPAPELARDDAQKDLAKELEQGHAFTLDKVYFFGNSAVAESSSMKQLDELVSFLNANKKSSIYIHGHTNGQNTSSPYFRPRGNSIDFLFASSEDEQFDDDLVKEFKASAEKLSLLRAKTVKYYLTDQGIRASRIKVKGWGDAKMIVDITAPNNHINRRVEIELEN